MFADGGTSRVAVTTAAEEPAREMLFDPHTQGPVRTSNVTASAVTLEVVDDVGLAAKGDRILERTNRDALGCEDESRIRRGERLLRRVVKVFADRG